MSDMAGGWDHDLGGVFNGSSAAGAAEIQTERRPNEN
jgi:hypothetical protein